MFEFVFVIFCYIILFILIFYLSFSSYSILVKLPFFILCIILITYTTYVAASYWSNPKKNETKQLFEIFQRFFIIYGEYILIIIGVFIVCILLYNIFMGLLVFSLSKSLWVTLGLIILLLALIKNSFYKTTQDGPWMTFIKDLIFYIPCLITDAIDFMKKDYLQTPSTTFIVFIMIIIYSIFCFVPLINTDGGNLLISGPQNLNTVTRFSTDEILLLNKMPLTYEYWSNDFSYNDISYTVPVKDKLYLRDKLTQNLEPFTGIREKIEKIEKIEREGFSGLVQQDTNYNYNFSFGKNNEIQQEDVDIGKLYHQVSQNVGHNFSTLYSIYAAIRDLFIQTPNKSPYTYNYGLSFWLYMNTFHFKKLAPKMQKIVSFGERMSLMYDNIENELVVLLNDEEVYRSKGILYQRWNHVVLNSGDSKLDLFINNNLVGTYEYKQASVVKLYDSLDIGSINNSNFGSICNFRYYNNILDLSKIKSIYTKYNKKSPPI